MAKRRSRRKSPRTPESEVGLVRVAIGAAERDPVDVRKVLRHARSLKTDEERAVALVKMAFDVDASTVSPFLDTLKHISDESWRARTIFSALQQADSRFTRELPVPAQEAVVALIEGIT